MYLSNQVFTKNGDIEREDEVIIPCAVKEDVHLCQLFGQIENILLMTFGLWQCTTFLKSDKVMSMKLIVPMTINVGVKLKFFFYPPLNSVN